MNHLNGASTHVHPVPAGSATCPTCGSKISHEKLEQILCLTEVRDQQLAEERAALEERQQQLQDERDTIIKEAAAAEQAKWAGMATELSAKVEQLQQTHAAALDKLAKGHEQRMEAEVRRRMTTETKLARDREMFRRQVERERLLRDRELERERKRREKDCELAAAKASAAAAERVKDAEATLREQQRAGREQHRELVAGLRAEIKTLEARRRREGESFKRQVALLQRKSEDRDRAHLGPEGEEALVALLRDAFPGDRIEHRGVGGDVLHFVVDRGHEAGLIVYEAKNTRSWSADYVKQTARAMEQHKTDFGVLCSRVLPARQSIMCVKDGVVVVVPEIVAQVAAVLRDSIVALGRMAAGAEDRAAKEAALVDYLRSAEFSGAIKRVGVKIGELRRSLEREKSAHGSSWTLREQAYTAILRESAGIDARITELLRGDMAPGRAAS